eukprot:CAMPEP_0181292196 /NCGR_PEP_ID=MMETSP1101-20121128/2375_1 /TAXON_ID=46948 /ORGANISM="Rhodomonas abbreviata, Strain Caron Lab Isolate" /LENGTH=206 /DNA_ID=CAMNT_0023396645 /DNA_START=21 /DNA_END=641 /DNA_ORIENTATION=+
MASSGPEVITSPQPLQSSVQRFEPVDGYSTFGKGAAGRSSRADMALKLGLVMMACVAVVALSGWLPSSEQNSAVELEGGSMKTIDGLLSHINKLTHDARSGHESDRSAKEQLSEQKNDDSSGAPSSVKKGINHISKALQAAESAESGLQDDDSDGEHRETAADVHKKKMIAAKMKALTDQIKHDFAKVTGFGNKAGFLPPVKMPHM